jgi:hypothetical protein
MHWNADFAPAGALRRCRLPRARRLKVILYETLPLSVAQPSAPSDEGPTVRLFARALKLRCRRKPSPESRRTWSLELEVELPVTDPERLLAECEGFLVDGKDGRPIGVVDRVETSGAPALVSALVVSAGWFGRRHLRVEARGIEAVVPAERRVIVDESAVTSLDGDSRSS